MSKSGQVRDIHDVRRAFEEDGIERVKVGGFDIDGVLRGKYIAADKLFSAIENGFGFCDVIFGWDMADDLYEGVGIKVTGWHTGYPDTLAKLDLSTYRPIPWEPGTAAFLADFWLDPDTPHPACPRNLLKRVIAQAKEMGYAPKFGSEYEFFIFDETPQTLAEKDFRGIETLDPGMFGYSWLRTQSAAELMHALLDDLEGFGIALEGLHTETGPGVFEAAIAYGDVLENADQAALFKTAVKAVCAQFDLTPTFMAKCDANLPGCSGHIHQSLWTDGGRNNAFVGADSEDGMSELMKSYIAGQLKALPEITSLIWPTINSYKRAVVGVWSPVNATWGAENRTCAVRAITGPTSKATRIEFRMPAADMNPYISMATSLAAGLKGVKEGWKPSPPVKGNAYDAPVEQAPMLPSTLENAVRLSRGSELASELVGPEFLDHYLRTRHWEHKVFDKAVTDWELRRYFEIV